MRHVGLRCANPTCKVAIGAEAANFLDALVAPAIPVLTDHGWGLAQASGKPPAIDSMACSSTLQPISRSSGVALSISL